MKILIIACLLAVSFAQTAREWCIEMRSDGNIQTQVGVCGAQSTKSSCETTDPGPVWVGGTFSALDLGVEYGRECVWGVVEYTCPAETPNFCSARCCDRDADCRCDEDCDLTLKRMNGGVMTWSGGDKCKSKPTQRYVEESPWECKTGIAYYARRDQGSGKTEQMCQNLAQYGYVYYSGSQHCYTYDGAFPSSWSTDGNKDWWTCKKRTEEAEVGRLEMAENARLRTANKALLEALQALGAE